MIYRYLSEKIERDFNKRKIIIVYGPRQVGKTTLVKKYLKTDSDTYYNCDQDETRELFEKSNLEHLSSLVKKYKTVIIDEAQRAKNIGLPLKILIDNFPDKNFIITGSSSLELAHKITEPLTGRFFSHFLHPIAECELAKSFNPIQRRESLESRLIFGSYPEVITTADLNDKQRLIENIAANYLFKDILSFGIVKNPDILKKLLQALSLQLGNEASFNELSNTLQIDKNTVRRYVELCEKAFIIFPLPPYFSNKRKSISKLKKYYFYDLGIRNALIRNFNPLDLRADSGALWENYMIMERIKFNAARDHFSEYYFWRSYRGNEIDLIEEIGGNRFGFEFKLSSGRHIKKAVNDAFYEEVKGSKFEIISKDNYSNFAA